MIDDLRMKAHGFIVSGWRSPISRRAHNSEIAGLNPAPDPNVQWSN